MKKLKEVHIVTLTVVTEREPAISKICDTERILTNIFKGYGYQTLFNSAVTIDCKVEKQAEELTD